MHPEQGGFISLILLFKIRKVGYIALKIKIRIASIGPTAAHIRCFNSFTAVTKVRNNKIHILVFCNRLCDRGKRRKTDKFLFTHVFHPEERPLTSQYLVSLKA